MSGVVDLQSAGLHARLADSPVSVHDYLVYLRANRLPVIPAPAHSCNSSEPVTNISQVDALAYCRWLGSLTGSAYRLPAIAELIEMSARAGAGGARPEFWPRTHAPTPLGQGHFGVLYFCEWTLETETCTPSTGETTHVLGSIFYPLWLHEGGRTRQFQGFMSASQGYSFVSFRVASDLT